MFDKNQRRVDECETKTIRKNCRNYWGKAGIGDYALTFIIILHHFH